MSQLSPQEEKVLDALLTTVPSVISANLHITEHHIATIKSRVRRKEAKAKRFLRLLKKYKKVLYPEKEYKGL
ncbi:unnamed protein product [marine sediment metagenome]|uniref:HTH luxR-type domain-containing protein n=1 Tax=marine sediment metagenome TaxID=412755 RepID=X1SS08_9ZZZZ